MNLNETSWKIVTCDDIKSYKKTQSSTPSSDNILWNIFLGLRHGFFLMKLFNISF